MGLLLFSVSFHCRERWHTKALLQVEGMKFFGVCLLNVCFLQVLVIVAASHLDAVTFQICSQSFKIMPTAVFAVWLLGQYLTPMQWSSLPVLAFGVVFVTMNGSSASQDGESTSDQVLLGLGASALSGLSSAYAGEAALQECVLSGAKISCNRSITTYPCLHNFVSNVFLKAGHVSTVRRYQACIKPVSYSAYMRRELTHKKCHAGVYFEKYVKGKQGQTLWIRNLQLSIYGVPLAIVYCVMKDGR